MTDEQIDELKLHIIAGKPSRDFQFIGELWPTEPPLTTPEKIRMCVTPSGDVVINHPDRPPLVVRNWMTYSCMDLANGPDETAIIFSCGCTMLLAAEHTARVEIDGEIMFLDHAYARDAL